MKKSLPLLGTALLLAACGGGGGGGNAAADTQSPANDNARDPVFSQQLEKDDLPDYVLVEYYLNGQRFGREDYNTLRAEFDRNVLPRGLSAPQTMQIQARKTDGTLVTEAVASRSYRGFHSALSILAPLHTIRDRTQTTLLNLTLPSLTATTPAGMPTSGRATYTGQAFGWQADNTAALTYHLDFGSKRGQGEIAANSYHSAITLLPGSLQHVNELGVNAYEIDAEASLAGFPYSGDYQLIFAGPQAEEFVGRIDVSNSKEDIYLAAYGTRGEITK